MKVLAIVQTWNAADPICGFIVRWMESLAERVDRLVVLALEQRQPSTRDNIRVLSLGKEAAPRRPNRARYLARWHHALRDVFRDEAPDAVFVHMSPIFAVLAAPYAKRAAVPIVTWYAHRHVGPTLRLAHRCSTRIVSVDRASYRHRPDEVVAIGHGIDTEQFLPGAEASMDTRLVLCVGRLSPIKDGATLVEAIGRLCRRGIEARAVFVGDAYTDADRSHAAWLRRLVAERGLEGSIRFAGAMPHAEVAERYRRSAVHVNLSPTGALDKAVLEAMACGRPVVVGNESFRDLVAPWASLCMFRHGDADDLAARLEALLDAPAATKGAIGAAFRARIVEAHGLDGMMTRLARVLAGAADTPVARVAGSTLSVDCRR